VAVVVARAMPVGVDVEDLDPTLDVAALARIALSSREHGQLMALPAQARIDMFLRYRISRCELNLTFPKGLLSAVNSYAACQTRRAPPPPPPWRRLGITKHPRVHGSVESTSSAPRGAAP